MPALNLEFGGMRVTVLPVRSKVRAFLYAVKTVCVLVPSCCAPCRCGDLPSSEDSVQRVYVRGSCSLSRVPQNRSKIFLFKSNPDYIY